MNHHTGSLLKVFGLLLAALALSALSSRFLTGTSGTVVALLLATFKMTVIFLYFMGLGYQPRLVRIFSVAGFFWLGILATLIAADYAGRM